MSIGAFAIGSAAVAGGRSSTSGTTVPPNTNNNLQVVIDFQDVSDIYLLDTLDIQDELGTRSVCFFSLYDSTRTIHPEPGESVIIGFNTIIRFAGTIEQVEEFAPQEATAGNFLRLTCADYNELPDRHVVAARYDTAGQTLKDVVVQIVEEGSGTDPSETLAADGITTGSVQTGPELGPIVFNYSTATEAFDDLAELTGFSWFIDTGKRLNFFDRRTFFAPRDLDDAVWQEYRNLRIVRDRSQFRNLQYLRAGTAVTQSNQVDRFIGDGENETFTTRFNIDEILSITVDAVPKTWGVRGVDEAGEQDFLFTRGNDTFSNDAASTLIASNDLVITYKGQFSIIVEGRKENEISDRIEQEGGSGIYADVESDQSIDDIQLAEEKVDSLLRRFGQVIPNVQFETDEEGFRAGQLLTVNLPQHDVQGDYLITSVRTSRISDAIFRYRVSAIAGQSQGNWVDFFKRLATKGRPFVLRENEKLLIIRTIDERLDFDDVVVTTRELASWTEDYYYGVAGNAQAGGTGTVGTYGSIVGAPPLIS